MADLQARLLAQLLHAVDDLARQAGVAQAVICAQVQHRHDAALRAGVHILRGHALRPLEVPLHLCAQPRIVTS